MKSWGTGSQSVDWTWKLGGVLLGLWVFVFGSGCAVMRSEDAIVGPEYRVTNVFRASTNLPATIRRVAVLPVVADRHSLELQTAGESLAPMVAEELQRSGRFEVVLVTPERLSGLTGQRELAMEHEIPTNALTRLKEAFACEAVLFTRVTQYRPYPPPAVGWRMKLVDCTTQGSIWAADEVFDSGESAVQNAARRYEATRSPAAPALADSRSILGSPGRFARYTLSALFGSLPSR